MPENVTLYTTGCPKCAILKKKLDEAQISYDVCEDVVEMQALGFLTAPMLGVGSRVYEFGDAVRWVRDYVAERTPSD